MTNEAVRKYLDEVHEGVCRVDQLRRTYADVPEAEFWKVYGTKLVEGGDAAAEHIRQTFGPRPQEAAKRTYAEIEAAEGPSIRIIRGRRPRTGHPRAAHTRVATENRPERPVSAVPQPGAGEEAARAVGVDGDTKTDREAAPRAMRKRGRA